MVFKHCIYVCSNLLHDTSITENSNTGAVWRLERVAVPAVEQVSQCDTFVLCSKKTKKMSVISLTKFDLLVGPV